jgi:hypothetical protein
MDSTHLSASLADMSKSAPKSADVFALRRHSLRDLHERGIQVIDLIAKRETGVRSRGEWARQANRTLVRLPERARAVIYHPSGAVALKSGRAPFADLFDGIPEKSKLIELAEGVAKELDIFGWAAESSLRFDRLWQIKAAAANKDKRIDPILCRAIGTWRQELRDLPILGSPAVSIRLAGGKQVDALSQFICRFDPKPVDRCEILPVDHALQVIEDQHGHEPGKLELVDLKLGYLKLGKRKQQGFLAPHYIASLVQHGDFRQGRELIIPATRRIYERLCEADGAMPIASSARPGPPPEKRL